MFGLPGCYRKLQFSIKTGACREYLMLATRAIISAPPGLPNLPDHASTPQTRLIGTIIDASLNLEAPGTAIAVHIVPNTAATGSNGIRQGFADSRHQDFIACTTDPVGRPQRRNTGAKQTFRSVDITDPNHQVAIHQGRLDRPATAGESLMQPVNGESIGQGLDPLCRQQRMLLHPARRPRLPEHNAETSWIGKAKNLLSQHQLEMIVLGGRQIEGHETQVTRHTQMNDQHSLHLRSGTVEQQILATAANSNNPTTRQQVSQFRRYLVAKLRRTDHHPLNHLPLKLWRQASATNLHFRQFRHCLFLRQNPNNIANLLDSKRSN